MWPDGRIVPASDRRLRESRRHALAQASGPVTTRFRVVIDVGVVMPDDLRILGRSRRWRREVLAHRNLLVPLVAVGWVEFFTRPNNRECLSMLGLARARPTYVSSAASAAFATT